MNFSMGFPLKQQFETIPFQLLSTIRHYTGWPSENVTPRFSGKKIWKIARNPSISDTKKKKFPAFSPYEYFYFAL